MTAYYLKIQYIFVFKVQIDLKQDQSFDHLLSLSDKEQMIKRKKKKQKQLALQDMSNESSKHRYRKKL